MIGLIYRHRAGSGSAIAVALALVLSLGAYFSGDRLVLASTRAREVTPEEQPRLHNIVEGLAIAAGVPKPRVYVVPEQAPNAFATGRDPEHSSIAVTQGLLDTMNRVELEGVIGHEMSHVVDRDILFGTVVATVVGAVGADLGVLHAELVVGRVRRPAERPTAAGRRGRRADRVRGRARAADPRADRSGS